MNNKIFIWIIGILSMLPVAFAQLFEAEGANSFVIFGITAIVIILVGKEIIKNFFGRKEK